MSSSGIGGVLGLFIVAAGRSLPFVALGIRFFRDSWNQGVKSLFALKGTCYKKAFVSSNC